MVYIFRPVHPSLFECGLYIYEVSFQQNTL